MYEPKLFPITTDFQLNMNTENLNLPKISKSPSHNAFDNLYIEIKNIGQGLASNINVYIDYDIDFIKIFEKLKIKIELMKIPIELKIQNNSLEYKDNDQFGCYVFEKNTTNNFDYCLPVNKSEKEQLIIMTPNLITLILKLNCLLIYSKWNNISDNVIDENDEINQISFKIKIIYHDIMNKKYEDKYILKYNFINLSTDMNLVEFKIKNIRV